MHIGKNNDDSCLTKPDSQAIQYPTIALEARHLTN